MDNNLKKSLTDLIDETLLELEELSKSRFAASEIKIEGPGDGIAGKPSDGDLDAKKADEEAEEEESEEKEDEESEEEEESEEHEEKEDKMKEMKKSLEESESLMKSYVEERVKPIEDKLPTILDLVNKIADQPVAAKGFSAKTTPLLKSADEGQSEPLSKAQIANKLFELKKSGAKVDSNDIVKAEMGQDLMSIVKKYEIS